MGRNLVLQGIALPTDGFKSPDDLSPHELMESVKKAYKIHRGWSSSTMRASRLTRINIWKIAKHTKNGGFNFIPLTSDIVLALLSQKIMVFMDIIREVELGIWCCNHCYFTSSAPLSRDIFTYDVDLMNKSMLFLSQCNDGKLGDILTISLFKTSFNIIRDTDRLSFSEVISFHSPHTHFKDGHSICISGGHILNSRERRLCIRYADETSLRKEIVLLVILDWSEPKAAFFNTTISVSRAYFL